MLDALERVPNWLIISITEGKSSANALGDRITARFTRYWSSEGLFQLSAKIDHWANKTEMEKKNAAIHRQYDALRYLDQTATFSRFPIVLAREFLLSLMTAISDEISFAIGKNYIKVLRILCTLCFV